MKRFIFIIALFIIFLTAIPSDALRCGCSLIFIGDPTFLVLKRCGEPIHKELIRHGIKGAKIESWVYGPTSGMYYYLIFRDGKLYEIESFRK